jgi:hypothetical protein
VETKPRNGYSLAVWLARTKALLLWLFNPLLKVLVSLAIWIRHLAQGRVILNKGVRDALAAVEREGLLVTSAEGARAVVEVLRWIGTHRDQVIATSNLIFIAVRETETFVSLSGPEKRQYATDLVMAALDDLGFKETSGLLYALVEALVKCGIEVAVHLLKKRGVFATSQ